VPQVDETREIARRFKEKTHFPQVSVIF